MEMAIMNFCVQGQLPYLNWLQKKPSPIWPSGISAILISSSSFFTFTLYDTGRIFLIFNLQFEIPFQIANSKSLFFPIQSTFFYDVDKPTYKKAHEHQYCPKAGPA